MATIDDVHAVLVEIRDLLRAGNPLARGNAQSSQGAAQGRPSGAIADHADLDSQYGDPDIRKDPPRWEGPSFVGCRYSEASPEYLDSLAGFLDWKAGKDEESGATTKAGKPLAPYSRKDAARARGWAKRIREGRVAPKGSPQGFAPSHGDYGAPPDDFGNDDIPF